MRFVGGRMSVTAPFKNIANNDFDAAQYASHWRCGRFLFSEPRALVMGVINVTLDSFSDGGLYHDTKSATTHGLRMIEEGADILDVGGVSTRPGAPPVSIEEEKKRLLPVVEALSAHGAVVSADTMNPVVMRAALDAGAAIINDVNACQSDDAIATIADSDCGIIIMHKQGEPQTMQQAPWYDDVFTEVSAFLQQQASKLEEAGVIRQRICLDPGIGFGKTAQHNWALLRRFAELSDTYPLLAGVSRKSLFADICKQALPNKRDVATAVASALLIQQGAFVLRVHNVVATREAIGVLQAMAQQ